MRRAAIRRAAIRGACALALILFVQIVAIRPWYVTWGATDAEVVQPLPGDNLVEHPRLRSTRAITIDAAPGDVWPWLVQMGKHRGGFYSYDWLENLAGFDIHSVDRIVPQWQAPKVGDEIELHPGRPLRVNLVEPNRAFVIGRSWAFVLQRIDGHSTRLIVRSLGEYQPDFGRIGNALIWHVLYEPAFFVMERKTMLGIKTRAEAAARRRERASGRDATP